MAEKTGFRRAQLTINTGETLHHYLSPLRTRALSAALAGTPMNKPAVVSTCGFLCPPSRKMRYYRGKSQAGWFLLLQGPVQEIVGLCICTFLGVSFVCFVVCSDKRLLLLHLGHKLKPLATVCSGGSMCWICLTFLSSYNSLLFANWHTQTGKRQHHDSGPCTPSLWTKKCFMLEL